MSSACVRLCVLGPSDNMCVCVCVCVVCASVVCERVPVRVYLHTYMCTYIHNINTYIYIYIEIVIWLGPKRKLPPNFHHKALALWAREGRGAKNTPTPTGISPGAAGT